MESIYTSHGLRGMAVGGVPLAWHQGSVSRADGAVQEAFESDGQPHALISRPQHETGYYIAFPHDPLTSKLIALVIAWYGLSLCVQR
jgi:hypothetical protein